MEKKKYPKKPKNKVERRPNESKQDCIDRGMSILVGEGFPSAQARAIAEEQYSKIGKCFWKGIF